MRRFLAKIIAPEIVRDSDAYTKIWHSLDDARWWLGHEFSEAASLAQFIIERDAWYWSRGKVRDDMEFCPPKWVVGIDSFRAWLEQRRTTDRA